MSILDPTNVAQMGFGIKKESFQGFSIGREEESCNRL